LAGYATEIRRTLLARRRSVDAPVAAALFVFALLVGVVYCAAFERARPEPEPWVKELGAAIAFACGYGFVDPGYEPGPKVAAFLDKKIDRISCEDLPAGVPTRPPNFTQSLYRYMTLAVAMTWKLFGISWTRLAVLFGLLYALTAVAVYGLFRLATPRAPAAIGAAIMTMSPLQLRYLPQLRDYAKAPFLLALIFILGLLVMRPFSRGRLLALAACYGAVAGIGFGFRNDLLIAALPFVVTVLAFLPGRPGAHIGPKLAALTLCALSFALCSWPIISAYRLGSNSGHVALLGLMTHFNGPLGVTTSVYDWGEPYDDGFAIKVISSYSERVHHRPVVALSSEDDKATVEYLLLIGRHWPADLLIRAYASVLRVVELPFQIRLYTTAAPPAIRNGIAARLYAMWTALLSRLSGLGVVVVGVAIVVAASSSLRVAAWLLLSLLYFAGYPAVQFDARHFFFLEFIPWLALASLCAAVVGALAPARTASAAPPAQDLRARGRRALAFGLGAVVAVGAPVVVLRAYQQRHVTALLDSYLETPTQAVTLSLAPLEADRVLLRPNELAQAVESKVRAEYLVLDIAREHCAGSTVPVTVRYTTLTGYTDLTRRIDVPVPRSEAPSRLFFPVYYSPGGYFAGVELAGADRGCVLGLRRVTDMTRTPVLLTLTLPPDWREMKLYQVLTPRGRRLWSHG
jgi:hypothetical protein